MRLYAVGLHTTGWDVLTEALVACEDIPDLDTIMQEKLPGQKPWEQEYKRHSVQYLGEAGPHIERGILMEVWHNG